MAESPANTQALVEEIKQLKEEQDAVILAHYYVDAQIQDLADLTGDSLKLARDAVQVQRSTIVFAGVHFMAETAKILNPEKRVLLPSLEAGCSLAESCTAEQLAAKQEELRRQGHDFVTVTYVNTTAEVKALSDWVVTSSNAVDVVRRIDPKKKILFVPDQHLGRYVMQETKREMFLWPGSCIVHEIFSLQHLAKLKEQHPNALVIAHPECPKSILDQADMIGGTEKMRRFVMSLTEPKTILVVTDANMIHPLQKHAPQHQYVPVPGVSAETGALCELNRCPHMGLNTLESIRDCLKRGAPEIQWQPCFEAAQKVVVRSFLEH